MPVPDVDASPSTNKLPALTWMEPLAEVLVPWVKRIPSSRIVTIPSVAANDPDSGTSATALPTAVMRIAPLELAMPASPPAPSMVTSPRRRRGTSRHACNRAEHCRAESNKYILGPPLKAWVYFS
jgi:hypothetical protein